MFDVLERFLVTEMQRQRVPGFSAAVVRGSDIAWCKGFGYADMEEKAPATPVTVYRVASVSKPVVTTGLLQWMERGRFRLDDPVNELMENVKIQTRFDKQPTVRNLLCHTSGLPVHADPICFDVSQTVALEEMIRKSAITVRPPDQEIVYSNTAFNIIGYLVGQFAGEPYPDYMRKNVLDPLEMYSSAFEQTPRIRKMMAQPYSRKKADAPIEAVKPWYGGSLPEKPCGSLFSSATDLSHFLIAQMRRGMYGNGRILNESTVDEMQKLQARAGISRSGYALSWKRTWHYGNLMLSHTGGNLGWTAHMAFYPELKVGIIILCNLNDNSGWRPPAKEALRLLVGGPLPVSPKTLGMREPPEQLKKFVGTYTREFRNVQVELENDKLILERGREKALLEKLDESRYLVQGGGSDGMELTFEYDERGVARQFDLETETFPRYIEDTRPIGETEELTGTWRGDYVHSYGYSTMKLRIDSQTQASAADTQGNVIPVAEFKAHRGRVTGMMRFKVSPEYVGWGAEEFQATLSLVAIEGKLEGTMSLKSEIGESIVSLVLSRV